ncbi:amino acid/amide ABC transporter ATP-binding protein 1 (HAAT family) [Cereibacter ovatus]|uniref:Amino acid/amide ABC transporter ATP-binding protein 1 (HAAT family) n=1 Tax=Cereibacter ovatus TaxID=439529 RepID=A0A285D3B1_9RHOB|nr:ABC transporter ATP-binding protein [Cereibacter ovatus]SNX74304.1 amino acid/amide ABC transporter ATP-binding protein 1 (HAAT family) [Cereibacter ovatus]
MTPALSVRGLTKSFDALKVSDGISFDVAWGELHAIIGPNGAGKTTLIHQLSGSLAPDAGRILLGGHDITRLSMAARARRGLARSFQITSILAGLTALENVALAVQARSGSSFRFLRQVARESALNDQAAEALAAAGLAGAEDRSAGTLSHGEKRQLEIAIALAMQPKVLLLDEPLAGTGHRESAALLDLIAGLKGRLSIVLIEHDMEAVFALADRISVLVYGRLIATGTPDAIRADAQVRAAYLGDEEGA